MDILVIYAFIAVTTACTALYELLMPVIRRRKSEGFNVDNKIITFITFFCISIVITPVILASCIIPSIGETFRNALYKGMFSEE